MESLQKTPQIRQLTEQQVKKIEKAISSSSTIDQACAFAGVPRRDFEYWLAKRLADEPEYLNDLIAQAQRLYALGAVAIYDALEKDDVDVSLALDVLGRRAPEWSTRSNLDLTSKGDKMNGGTVDPQLEEVRQKFLKEAREKI